MITLVYEQGGEAVSDFDVEFAYQWIIKHANPGIIHCSYSTSNIFHRVRLGIAEGDISPGDVIFMYDGDRIEINKYGAICKWPEGFLALDMFLAEKILLTAFALRKKEKS